MENIATEILEKLIDECANEDVKKGLSIANSVLNSTQYYTLNDWWNMDKNEKLEVFEECLAMLGPARKNDKDHYKTKKIENMENDVVQRSRKLNLNNQILLAGEKVAGPSDLNKVEQDRNRKRGKGKEMG